MLWTPCRERIPISVEGGLSPQTHTATSPFLPGGHISLVRRSKTTRRTSRVAIRPYLAELGDRTRPMRHYKPGVLERLPSVERLRVQPRNIRRPCLVGAPTLPRRDPPIDTTVHRGDAQRRAKARHSVGHRAFHPIDLGPIRHSTPSDRQIGQRSFRPRLVYGAKAIPQTA